MKRLSLLLLIIGLIFVCSQSTTAQETKQKKEAKVKVLINKGGKSIKFDTIIHEFKHHKEIMKIIKSKHLSDSLFEVIEGADFMWISDDKDSHGKHKVIIKEFHDSDSSLHSKMSKHIRVISDDDENIIITEGDGEHKTIKIEIIDEDGNIHKKHSKGKEVYIIKIDIDIEIEVSEDGKTTKKIKKIKKKAKKTEKKEK